jgi:hypothetical protein
MLVAAAAVASTAAELEALAAAATVERKPHKLLVQLTLVQVAVEVLVKMEPLVQLVALELLLSATQIHVQ